MANPGQKLYFSRFGGEQPIPPEFIAAMNRTEEVQSLGEDVTGPEPLSGTIIESSVETNRTNERVRKTVKKKPGNIVLRAINTNDQGQPVQVTRTLFPTGSPYAVPDATQTVAVHDLGNGWSIQEVGVEGVYVNGVFTPNLFGGEKYTAEVPDTLPNDFKALIETDTFETTQEGSADLNPPLPGGLLHSEQQLTSFTKRVIDRLRNFSLPAILTGKQTNQQKQVVTVTRTLKYTGTASATPSATKDVDIENLGDGTEVQTQKDVPVVFDPVGYAKTRPEVLPERFRAAIPLITEGHEVAGSASAPTLAAGDVEKSERQVNAFVKETRVANRNVGSPPTLAGQTVDETFGVAQPYTETIEVAGTSIGQNYKIVEPLGDGTDLTRTLNPASFITAMQNFSLSFPGTANIPLPDVLEQIQYDLGVSVGSGNYMVDYFFGQWEGHGSYSLPIRAEAQGSGSAIYGVSPVIRQPWARNIPSVHYMFFLLSPASSSQILAKVSTMAGGQVQFLPKFSPRGISVVTINQSVSLRANADWHIQDGGSSTSSEHTEFYGGGISQEVQTRVEIVRIPPTIHASQTFSDFYTQDLLVEANSYAVGRSNEYTLESDIFSVGAQGTSGAQTIPTSGLYIVDTNAAPYRYGYIRVQAEVVNFANVG